MRENQKCIRYLVSAFIQIIHTFRIELNRNVIYHCSVTQMACSFSVLSSQPDDFVKARHMKQTKEPEFDSVYASDFEFVLLLTHSQL